MNCKEFRAQVADLFDKQVNPQTKAECERHMAECDECRHYYENLCAAAELLRPRTIHSPRRLWRRVAAVFGGVILAAGIGVAAMHFAGERTSQSRQAKADPVRFTNVRLDSILSVVSRHYGQTVVFQNDEPREMQLIMTWKPDAPLSDFIDRLNAFDGLRLNVHHDTIFVTQTEKEDKE